MHRVLNALTRFHFKFKTLWFRCSSWILWLPFLIYIFRSQLADFYVSNFLIACQSVCWNPPVLYFIKYSVGGLCIRVMYLRIYMINTRDGLKSMLSFKSRYTDLTKRQALLCFVRFRTESSKLVIIKTVQRVSYTHIYIVFVNCQLPIYCHKNKFIVNTLFTTNIIILS